MTRTTLTMLALLAAGAPAFAASAVNNDAEVHTIIVTEGGDRSELTVAAGETVEFCPTGCFVTMPDGERHALTGTEVIEITDGKGRLR